MRMLAFAALIAAGCGGGVMVQYHKSVATAAILAGSCRDVLSKAHDQQTSEVQEIARAGDPATAKAKLDAWLPKYDKIRTACVSLKEAAQLGLASGPVIEAARDKRKDALGWIARLTALGAEVVSTLAEFGLQLPGGQ